MQISNLPLMYTVYNYLSYIVILLEITDLPFSLENQEWNFEKDLYHVMLAVGDVYDNVIMFHSDKVKIIFMFSYK